MGNGDTASRILKPALGVASFTRLVPFEQEVWWAPELVWTQLWRREKFVSLPVTRLQW